MDNSKKSAPATDTDLSKVSGGARGDDPHGDSLSDSTLGSVSGGMRDDDSLDSVAGGRMSDDSMGDIAGGVSQPNEE